MRREVMRDQAREEGKKKKAGGTMESVLRVELRGTRFWVAKRKTGADDRDEKQKARERGGGGGSWLVVGSRHTVHGNTG